jgi:hypothetical protein
VKRRTERQVSGDEFQVLVEAESWEIETLNPNILRRQLTSTIATAELPNSSEILVDTPDLLGCEVDTQIAYAFVASKAIQAQGSRFVVVIPALDFSPTRGREAVQVLKALTKWLDEKTFQKAVIFAVTQVPPAVSPMQVCTWIHDSFRFAQDREFPPGARWLFTSLIKASIEFSKQTRNPTLFFVDLAESPSERFLQRLALLDKVDRVEPVDWFISDEVEARPARVASRRADPQQAWSL